MVPTTQLDDRERRLHVALAECIEALDEGPSPNSADWVNKYPEFSAELRELFQQASWEKNLDGKRADPLSVGEFAGYELFEVLGQGGMGVVYRARQTNSQRIVALKMMSAGRFATAAERQRFVTEIEAASRLDHPRIVPIYEVSEAEGQPFFTMRYLDGGNLGNHLERLRGDPAACARLVAALARGVHHAHERGVLHRDLKPANVLLDQDDRPHAADFGLARLVEATEQTATGELVGTPSYMAPEQAAGQRTNITVATDVYGLGAVLYACLTGQPPFATDSVVTVLEQVRSRDPQPPGRLNPAVPRDLDAVCMKCLNKDPRRRYSSAADLADDLERHLAGRPVKARLVRWPERLWRWARRRPELSSLLLLATVAVVTLITVLVVHQQRMGDVNEQLADAVTARQLHQDAQMRHYANSTFLAGMQLTSKQPVEARTNLALLCDPALAVHREFTWRYLWRRTRCYSRIDTWDGHFGRILAMALSPDGRTLATAAADNTIRFWNAETGRGLARVDISQQKVFDLDFSRSGQSVYVYLVGPTSRILEISITGAVRQVVQFSGFATGRLAPDKQSIYVVCGDPDVDDIRWQIVVVDVTTGKLTGTLLKGYHPERAIAMSEAGEWIAVRGLPLPASADEPLDEKKSHRSITLVHRQTKITRVIADSVNDQISMFAMTPTGRYLAVATHTIACMYDVATGQRLWSKTVRDEGKPFPWNPISSLSFSPNGEVVLIVGANRNLIALRTQTGTEEFVKQFPTGPVTVIWSRHWPGLFVGNDQSPHVCYWARKRELKTYEFIEMLDIGDEGWSLAVTPDSKRIIVATDNVSSPSTVTWQKGLPTKKDSEDTPPSDLHRTAASHTALASAVAIAPVEGRAYTASFDNSVAVWDVETCELLQIQPIASANNLRSISASPDGRLVATADRSGKIHLLDAQKLAVRGTLDGHGGKMIRALLFVNGGTVLASGGHDGQVLLWDMKSLKPTLLANVGNKVHGLAASPDGRTLTAASESGQLISWDLKTNKQCGLIYAHDGVAFAVAYSPDGQTLASGGADWKVRLWHVATALPLTTLKGPKSCVMAVAFMPDGNALISTGLDKTVRIWRADPALP